MNRKTICFVGWGRSGKDEAASTLDGVGPMKFCGSTSWQALPFIARKLRVAPQIAWETRHQNRQFWKDYCDWLRRDDPAFLIRLALEAGNIVSGIRDRVEIEQARKEKLFDRIVWIDRPGTPVDPTVTFGSEMADFVIINAGSLESYRQRVLGDAIHSGFITQTDILDAQIRKAQPLTIP
jgi:hypothetical protein